MIGVAVFAFAEGEYVEVGCHFCEKMTSVQKLKFLSMHIHICTDGYMNVCSYTSAYV